MDTREMATAAPVTSELSENQQFPDELDGNQMTWNSRFGVLMFLVFAVLLGVMIVGEFLGRLLQ